ncbi:MAG TPA: response regulator [Gemmataceae bacterium]|jgi:CheY-like chemotaxis protein|nr:response regulator [Gemmataceae bacterium]
MPLRVLLADRDSKFLELHASQLALERITVATAATGLECLAKLRTLGPDVLVLNPDLLWGGGNGVLATMAEDPELDAIPVIIVCDRIDNGSFSKPEAPQVREYLTKPFTPTVLARAIRKVAASPKVLVSADSSLWLG